MKAITIGVGVALLGASIAHAQAWQDPNALQPLKPGTYRAAPTTPNYGSSYSPPPPYAAPSFGNDHLVSGYTRSNGTYVAPHYQTNPNATKEDNYSTRGNVNPYTGQPGTKSPY